MAWLSFAGLVLNFFGTIMVAFSFGKNLGDAYQEDSKRRKIYLASLLYPQLFKAGLMTVAVGFVFQAIPVLQQLCSK